MGGGRIRPVRVLELEVFRLKVSSCAFPTPFRRLVRFVTSLALWVIFWADWRSLRLSCFFLSSFRHSFLMSWFLLKIARDPRVNAGGKEAITRSCCCRGSGHGWVWNVFTLLKFVYLKFSF